MGARLALGFSVLIGVMAFHEAEHVVQVAQKNVVGASCPNDCRGLLGFAFDVEWVHFAYNTSIFVGIAAVAVALRLWRAPRTFGWALLATAVVVQGYHALEHGEKLAQWFANGRRSPTPGILGQHLSLVELHFGLNTLVFALVAGAWVAYGTPAALWSLLRAPPRLAVAAAALVLLVAGTAAGWSQRPDTVRLAAGVHQGPIVVDRPLRLVGEPGAVVRGGIVVRSNDVVVRDLTVEGGEHGIAVLDAEAVLLERVTVRGAALDGIHARSAAVVVRGCTVDVASPRGQGIDVSFTGSRPASAIRGCTVTGGQEGIVSHFAHVAIARNRVSGTSLRGIAMTEMSMGPIRQNVVADTLGVAIFCGDMSHCDIRGNAVERTRRDAESGARAQAGYGILAHYHAHAVVRGNTVRSSPAGVGAMLGAEIVEE